MRLKLAARSSHLARLQAYQVAEFLKKKNPQIQIEFQFRESLGDRNLTDPLWKMPEKGVFTEDFYQDLIQEKTDFVVHSWKDLPTEGKSDTVICATLPRADQRDLLLFKKQSLKKIEQSKKVNLFTSSQRRIYNLKDFLLSALPYQPNQIQFHDIRGNIPTRLNKLKITDEVDGLILAKAALDRLLSTEENDLQENKNIIRNLLNDFLFMVLPLSENPNAAAQGALAIEIKKDRKDLFDLFQSINDLDVFKSVEKERSILSSYGGGCHQKIGISVLQRPYGEVLYLKGLTDQGEVLNQKKLTSSLNSNSKVKLGKKFNLSEVADLFSRQEVSFEIPKNCDAVVVSRAIAYRDFSGYVWAAGNRTWQQLAKMNVWVNGSCESLGESENPQIDILAGKKLSWFKLTHVGADSTEIPKVATYQIKLNKEIPKEALQADSLFWMSAYQFDILTAQYPELLQKNHCCGVGQTYTALTERLAKLNKKPLLFLDQHQWSQHE